jgi:hypothetical protein
MEDRSQPLKRTVTLAAKRSQRKWWQLQLPAVVRQEEKVSLDCRQDSRRAAGSAYDTCARTQSRHLPLQPGGAGLA